MSDTGTTAPAPARRFNWLKAALIASLAVNLLFIGGGIARWYVGFGPERYARLTQTQLIPRYFFRDLDRARRLELLRGVQGPRQGHPRRPQGGEGAGDRACRRARCRAL